MASPDRDRAVGAAILGAAVAVALLLVGMRLILNREEAPLPAPIPSPPLAQAPTPTPATELASPPAVAPTLPPDQAPALAADGAPAPDGRAAVCLDPGHGGSDFGNVRREDGVDVLYEEDFTLAHTVALAERLRADGIEVALTRTSDIGLNPDNRDVNGDGTVAPPAGDADSDQLDDLQARVLFCNAAGADLLVSIHYNGAENTALQGYEVWYNGARPFSDRSARFATIAHEELGAAFSAAGYAANDRGIGTEDHAVTGPERPGKLTPSAMPGAVVEGLFLSNDEDAAFITSEAASEAIVGAYERAIVRYFAEYPG